MQKHSINYSFAGNKIIIYNKRKQVKAEKKNTPIPAEQDEVKSSAIKAALRSDPEAEKISVQIEKKNEFDKILEEENLFNLIESHLSQKMIVAYNETHLDTCCDSINIKYREKYLKYINVLNKAMQIKDISSVIHGQFISGSEGLNRKNEAMIQIHTIQDKVIKSLDKLYTDDEECYIEIMKRIRTNKLLTFDTGIIDNMRRKCNG